MTKTKRLLFIFLGLATSTELIAQEQNNGELGLSTRGHVNMTLQKPTGALAGLATALNNRGSDNRSFVARQVLEELASQKSARISICITSEDESSFDVSSLNAANRLENEFGEKVSFDIAFGASGETSAKYKSSRGNCDNDSTIPLTINLERPISGQSARRIRGKINLLVKAE